MVTPFNETAADLSPDGQWLAYESDKSGQVEVYVSSFPDVAESVLISDSGGSVPRWGPQGGELFYLSAQGLMRVPLEFDAGLNVGTPESLFPIAGYAPTFDIAPDGHRFLLFKEEAESGADPQVVLVQNWFEELERLAPTN